MYKSDIRDFSLLVEKKRMERTRNSETETKSYTFPRKRRVLAITEIRRNSLIDPHSYAHLYVHTQVYGGCGGERGG